MFWQNTFISLWWWFSIVNLKQFLLFIRAGISCLLIQPVRKLIRKRYRNAIRCIGKRAISASSCLAGVKCEISCTEAIYNFGSRILSDLIRRDAIGSSLFVQSGERPKYPARHSGENSHPPAHTSGARYHYLSDLHVQRPPQLAWSRSNREALLRDRDISVYIRLSMRTWIQSPRCKYRHFRSMYNRPVRLYGRP